jgi:DNA-binding NarL/FixJ family response regulator
MLHWRELRNRLQANPDRICFTSVKSSAQNHAFVSAIYSDLLLARVDSARATRTTSARPRQGNTPAATATAARLTSRELEVLRWVAQGKRNREIGAIMSISPRTIQKHVQSILVKLCVETRGAAAAVWFEEMIRLSCRSEQVFRRPTNVG